MLALISTVGGYLSLSFEKIHMPRSETTPIFARECSYVAHSTIILILKKACRAWIVWHET
jgi:hypothetical protein